MYFDGKTFKSPDTVDLLGVTLDKNISFKRYMQNICHKANNKTKALFRRNSAKPGTSTSISRGIYIIKF